MLARLLRDSYSHSHDEFFVHGAILRTLVADHLGLESSAAIILMRKTKDE